MVFVFHQVIKFTINGDKKGCLITTPVYCLKSGKLQHFRFYSYQNANLINFQIPAHSVRLFKYINGQSDVQVQIKIHLKFAFIFLY